MKKSHSHFNRRLTANEQERAIKQVLLQEARACGPSVAQLVQTVWAGSILEMVRDSRELMDLACRYSPERLQAACRRAIYYRKDRSFYIIPRLLEDQYDRLPLSPYTDIEGQFLFSFESCDRDSLNNVESRLICKRKAV
jgi:hypothetical protein